MTYLTLTSGAYQSRTLAAAAQRSLNLYVESIPRETGEPSPTVHNLTPGLTLLSVAPQSRIRCLYKASTGDLFAVAGQYAYSISSDWQWHQIGDLNASSPIDTMPRSTPVSMADNGTKAIVSDGSLGGWTFNVQTKSGWKRITDDGWYGSPRVVYTDTFFVASKPDTPVFYVSGSEDVTWDAIDFASKSSLGDSIVAVAVMRRNLWLIGEYSCEVWFNSGGEGTAVSSFPFSITPAFHDIGCCATYSIAQVSDQLFWLSQDAAGKGIVIQANGYNVTRISTHAIEVEFSKYGTLSDAIGFCYQQHGHVFFVISFPSADKTWCYDLVTQQWHERCWIDVSGVEHRHRANAHAFAYDTNVVGDWENGNLYKLDPECYTDNLMPIKRLRSFPHLLDPEANRRVFYQQLIANMAVGLANNNAPIKKLASITVFDGVDGTYLENANKGFTLLTPNVQGRIVQDRFVPVNAEGTTIYKANYQPVTANYTATITVNLDNYEAVLDSGSMWVMGRATDALDGYCAGLAGDGHSFYVFLRFGNVEYRKNIVLVAIAGMELALDMVDENIMVSVKRVSEGWYLDTNGGWAFNAGHVFAIQDTTFIEPGNILIGSS